MIVGMENLLTGEVKWYQLYFLRGFVTKEETSAALILKTLLMGRSQNNDI